MKIGVLALQGDVSEHIDILRKINVDCKIVKKREDIREIKGLIIPGGESTTMIRLMEKTGIYDEILSREDLGIFGTCAGAILLAKEILNYDQDSLRLMDIKVERNAYGRQRESFEAYIKIPKLGVDKFRGVFIRAPIIREIGEKVEILSEYEGNPVLVQQDIYLASTFHPELTNDVRIHKYFVEMLKEKL